MRSAAAVALLTAMLGAGLAAPVGNGPAPHSASIAPPRPAVTDGTGVLQPPSDAPVPELEAELIVAGLDRPTSAVAAGPETFYVTEKSGRIVVVADGTIRDDLLLDLDAEVPDSGTEQGLLSIALHPDFEENGRLFVNLTDAEGDVRVIEYRMADDPSRPHVADPRSARLLIEVQQPGQFHNGGMLQFGPDGYLFASFGDGNFGRSQRNARVVDNLLGSIIRIDVDHGAPYSVPAGNPFVGTNHAAEIWVFGMRNPWRFWIDAEDRVLVVGDVGQYEWEEVTVLPLDRGGLDLGWPVIEASHCYETDPCDRAGLVLPTIEYRHPPGCAVIGGPVYRGGLIPELRGRVVYADYCTGFVKAFGLRDGHPIWNETLIEPGTYGPILSLAVDEDGEILLLTQKGEMRRLQSARG